MGLRDLAAAIRNLVVAGQITRRDGAIIQGTTHYGRTVKGKEQFPYGFAARGKEGTVLFLFEGGDVRNPVMLPVVDQDGVPDLDEYDSALWTKTGGWIVCRNSGSVELYGTKYGGVIKVEELTTQLNKMTARIDGIINAISTAAVASGDGGSTFKSNIITVLSSLVDKENFSGLASEKVLHGDGSN
ncbi:hypothetical protein [Sediminispirochaeta bajacaliforniensis]|uniref:hypothetical protein n=1 Tax=Sediminispirochaeta bajacaliforniensis TaxID=148 RepID=UPI000365BB4F|nr:hypothetical protein [Sediminispirochaeta bajacaliforniensis]